MNSNFAELLFGLLLSWNVPVSSDCVAEWANVEDRPKKSTWVVVGQRRIAHGNRPLRSSTWRTKINSRCANRLRLITPTVLNHINKDAFRRDPSRWQQQRSRLKGWWHVVCRQHGFHRPAIVSTSIHFYPSKSIFQFDAALIECNVADIQWK